MSGLAARLGAKALSEPGPAASLVRGCRQVDPWRSRRQSFHCKNGGDLPCLLGLWWEFSEFNARDAFKK